MIASRFVHYCTIVLTSALLAACGATQSPIALPAQSFSTFPYAFEHGRRAGCPCLYVANLVYATKWSGSIIVYPESSNGNVKPVATIAGPATQLAEPFDVAVGDDGEIYVANYDVTGMGSVTVYAAGSSGNVAPLRAITSVRQPTGVAVDAFGFVYVTGGTGAGSVFVFAPGANGNATPVRTIAGPETQLGVPWRIALDSMGDAFVGNYYGPVTVYAAHADGNVAPIQDISGRETKLVQPLGVAVDSSDDIYVANYGSNRRGDVSSVLVYAAGATGNVPPLNAIHGRKTKLHTVGGIALDASANVYVSNGSFDTGPASVTVYAAGSARDARPIRTIKGDKTGLSEPAGITIR